MTRARLLLLPFAALLVLTGCGSSAGLPATSPRASTPAPATSTPAVASAYHRYVALGDSYTAAPFVPTTTAAGGCIRSDHNYPHLIAAAAIASKLVDVSCSGAQTKDLTSSQRRSGGAFAPPQDRALTKDTDLVTVGIGGNDGGLFGTIGTLCGSGSSSCDLTAAVPKLATSLQRLGPDLVTALRTIRRKAPRARVLVVGYPKIAPDTGGCAQLPAMKPADLTLFNKANLDLDMVIASAARTARVTYVDVYDASKGHDVCSSDPWVNGINTDVHAAAALHPFAREQVAVAKLVEASLTR